MKKLIILLLFATALVATVQAQNTIVLKMKDGTKNVVFLKGPDSSPYMTPYITFEDNDIVIYGDQELRLPMSQVQNYTYSDHTSIKTVVGETPTVLFKNNEIDIANQPEGTTAMIYAANGQLVKSVTTKGSNSQISLDGLAQGVYVMKMGRATFKFVKR